MSSGEPHKALSRCVSICYSNSFQLDYAPDAAQWLQYDSHTGEHNWIFRLWPVVCRFGKSVLGRRWICSKVCFRVRVYSYFYIQRSLQEAKSVNSLNWSEQISNLKKLTKYPRSCKLIRCINLVNLVTLEIVARCSGNRVVPSNSVLLPILIPWIWSPNHSFIGISWLPSDEWSGWDFSVRCQVTCNRLIFLSFLWLKSLHILSTAHRTKFLPNIFLKWS